MFSINIEKESFYVFGVCNYERIEFEQVNFYYLLNSDKPRRLVKDCYSDNITEQRPKSTLGMGQII